MYPRKIAFTTVLIALYFLAFVGFTYPLVTEFDKAFISEGGDGCIFVWNVYNFTENFHQSKPLFSTHRIYHPLGSSLILHVYAPVVGVIGLAVGNPILALNLAVLISSVLSGLGAYLLCNLYVKDRPLAALAGFAFAYCPYKLMHIYGHYDLMLTATLPFFVLCFVRAFKPAQAGRLPTLSNKRNLITAFILLAVTFFSSYYYTYFLMIFVVLYFAYFAMKIYDWSILNKKVILLSGIVVVASSGLVGLMDSIALDKTGLARNALRQSADAIAFFVPSAFSRFLGSGLVQHIRFDIIRGNEAESTVYVGYAVVVFAIGYLLARQYREERRAEGRLISYMAGCYLVFAMPVVLVADRIICALPTALIHYVPFINNFRVPYRHTIMLMLFVPILACLFIKARLWPVIPKRLHVLVVSALMAILFVEYVQRPYPMISRQDVPGVYEYLARQEDGVLIEIPFGLRDGFHAIGDERTVQMFYQTVHKKPILGGVVSRPGKEIFSFFEGAPIISDLIRMQQDSNWDPGPLTEEQKTVFLKTFDPRYVLIYPEYRKSRVAAYVETVVSDRIATRQDFGGFVLMTLRAGE
jgi:hypothetical protein